MSKEISASKSSAIPLYFVENVGQFDRMIEFRVHGGSCSLSAKGIQFTPPRSTRPVQKNEPFDLKRNRVLKTKQGKNATPASSFELRFLGSRKGVSLSRSQRSGARFSYYLGADPKQWHSKVPVWHLLRYKELYPGIGLDVSGDRGRLTFRLVAKKGVDTGKMRWLINGAKSVKLANSAGASARPEAATHLNVTTKTGSKLVPLIEFDGSRHALPSVKKTREETFEIMSPFASAKPTDEESEHVIDPPYDPDFALHCSIIIETAYLDIAIDRERNVYAVGNLDPTGRVVGRSPTRQSFVIKLDSGGGVSYFTVVGGSDDDFATAIAVDDDGNAYITGETYSPDFPVTRVTAFQPELSSNVSDAFVTKLDSGGALSYSTYLGGKGREIGRGIAVDSRRWIYVVGNTTTDETSSPPFPTTSAAFSRSLSGPDDVFITVLKAERGPLLYSTYLGGSGSDYGWGIAVRGDNICVTGGTSSPDFPTTPSAFDRTYTAADPFDPQSVFVTVLQLGRPGLLYSTYLNGGLWAYGLGIAMDESSQVYVVGHTSDRFPVTPSGFQTAPPSSQTGFIVKINPFESGAISLKYSSYFGGLGLTMPYGIALDRARKVYMTGMTTAADFPVTPDAFQPTIPALAWNAFAARFNLDVTGTASREYCSYYGGSTVDWGYGIAVDDEGNLYIGGTGESLDLPYRRNSHGAAFDDGYVFWLRRTG